MPDRTIERFDRLIRRDPARRGLIESEPQFGPLCPGHLRGAARELAEAAVHVGLVTGFFVPDADPPAAETDGPPGTLLLAAALQAVGVEVHVVTDELCLSAVAAAAEAYGFPRDSIVAHPHGSLRWADEFFATGPGRTLTHLVAVERVGPSHTPGSFIRQARGEAAPYERFAELVSVLDSGRCHNMRGTVIDAHTAELHVLFDELQRHRRGAKTIGVGDGGNEIGMGTIAWEELHRRLAGEHAGRIPCRVATDWTVVAGTSNWGAAALAAAVLLLRDRVDVARDWDRAQQLAVLERMVAHGPAVDGVTRRPEPTVDGLPFLTYIQPWEGIRRLLGFGE